MNLSHALSLLTLLAFGASAADLPVRRIPNIPPTAEAYYAPDSLHIISSAQDPLARRSAAGGPGSLVHTYTDVGT